jgi:hypothetical protein
MEYGVAMSLGIRRSTARKTATYTRTLSFSKARTMFVPYYAILYERPPPSIYHMVTFE